MVRTGCLGERRTCSVSRGVAIRDIFVVTSLPVVFRCLVVVMVSLRFPLEKDVFLTSDSCSELFRNWGHETEIPVSSSHSGAFGSLRATRNHEGVDLPGIEGDPVYAMEDSFVVALGIFSGAPAGLPWTAHTHYVMLEGANGVLSYGEIHLEPGLFVGTAVKKGTQIGRLCAPRRVELGRAKSVLHLEKYRKGTTKPLWRWALGAPCPATLENPTCILVQAALEEGRVKGGHPLVSSSRATACNDDFSRLSDVTCDEAALAA